MKMKDKWFERGGFLYDITKEYGRLRKCTNILDCSENPKGNLDSWEIDLLDSLSCKEKEFVKKQLHTINDSCKRNNFVNHFTWPRGPSAIENNNLRLKVHSFINTNFIYKLPDDWDTDRLLRYFKLWAGKFGYWPENESLRYSIDVIVNNYPKYWECVPKKAGNAEAWVLQNNRAELTTDIATSFWEPFKRLAEIKTTKKEFCKDKGNIATFKEKISKSVGLKAFSEVVYTIGNIIPVAVNYSGGEYNDNLAEKLYTIKDAVYLPKDKRTEILEKNVEPKLTEDKKKIKNKRKIKNDEAAILFLHWLEYFKDSNEPEDAKKNQKIWNKFIEDHYLQDFVKNTNGNYTIPICTKNPIDLTKGIIQRGYRIYYQYERDNEGKIKKNEDGKPVRNQDLFNKHLSFTCKAKKELQIAFKAVGIPDDNLNLI